MILKTPWVLGRTPGFTDKSIHIRPQHGTGMIHNKKWIKSDLLEFPLPGDTSALARKREVFRSWQIRRHKSWIALMLIALHHHFRWNDRTNFLKQSGEPLEMFIFSFAIFFESNFWEMPEWRNLRNLYRENSSTILIDGKRNGKRL